MKRPDPEDRALVVLLPEALAQRIDRWRARFDPNYGIVPAHITVAYPPFVPDEEWATVGPTLLRCLGQVCPFDIRLSGTGTFRSDYQILWLRLEDGRPLRAAHRLLKQCVPDYMVDRPYAYRPHLTVGAFTTETDLRSAQRLVRSELGEMRFSVQEFVYLAPDSIGTWCECSRLPLGHTC